MSSLHLTACVVVGAVCSRQVARSLTGTAKLYATGEPTQTRHQFGFGRSAIAPSRGPLPPKLCWPP